MISAAFAKAESALLFWVLVIVNEAKGLFW